MKHPAVALPPTLGQEPTCPSGVLLLTGSQADYVLITPAEERERESGRGAAGWLPRPAGSLGPNTALMRAGGADGHTRGAKDYCPGPRGARERDPRRGDASRDSCSRPVLLQSFCKHVLNLTSLFCFDDGLAWFVMLHHAYIMSAMHATLLISLLAEGQVSLQINKWSTGEPPHEDRVDILIFGG